MQTLDIQNTVHSDFNSFRVLGGTSSSDIEKDVGLLEQLQTSLEIDKLLNIFAMEAAKYIDFSGLYFKVDNISASILGSKKAKSERRFELKINDEFFGVLTYTINSPISLTNFNILNRLHKHLAHPLKNAVMYRKVMSLAMQDSLTGLGNRRHFDEQLKRALHHANRQHRHLGLIIGDLDKFKAVNDNYGHAIGDKVLVEFSKALRSCIRDSDSLFRFGGDEFVILVEEACDKSLHIIENRLQLAIRENAFLAKYNVGCSLGFTFMNRADTEDSFFKRADQSLYHKKMNMPCKLSIV
jgi:diguanylate cyclase (GGDEF)-like protein